MRTAVSTQLSTPTLDTSALLETIGEICASQDQLENFFRETFGCLGSLVDELDHRNNSLEQAEQTHHEECSRRQQHLQQHRAELEATLSQIESLTATLTTAVATDTDTAGQLQQVLAHAEEDRSMLRSAVEASDSSRADLARLSEELAAARSDLAAAREEIQCQRELLNQAASANGDAELEARLAALESQRAEGLAGFESAVTDTAQRLPQVLEYAEEDRTMLRSAVEVSDSSRADLARLSEELAAARNDLAAAREEIQSQRELLDQATSADGDAELDARLAALESQRAEGLAGFESAVTDTAQRLQQVLEYAEEDRTMLRSAVEVSDSSRADLARLAEELAAARSDLAAAREEIQSQRELLDQAASAGANGVCDGEIESRLDAIEHERAQWDRDRVVLEMELDAVRNQAAELAEALDEERHRAVSERGLWNEELKRMRHLLETRESQPAPAATRLPDVDMVPAAPAPQAQPEEDPSAANDPVLDSVMAQFEILQKDLARRRKAKESSQSSPV